MKERHGTKQTELSVVIPVFNEGGNVGPLMAELAEVLDSWNIAWEVLWIDDASTDGTLAELQSLMSLYSGVRVIRLERHSGQSAALWTGLQAARGSTIATLDGDGQNHPQDIPRLLGALEAADMVIGFRKRRHDPLAKRLFSWLANIARNRLTGSRIPDSGCGLRAFRRVLVACLLPFDGMHRFLPTLAEIAGLRVLAIEVNHRPRRRGRSKYGILDRLVGPLVDCLMLRWLKQRRLKDDVTSRELRTTVEPAADTPPLHAMARRV